MKMIMVILTLLTFNVFASLGEDQTLVCASRQGFSDYNYLFEVVIIDSENIEIFKVPAREFNIESSRKFMVLKSVSSLFIDSDNSLYLDSVFTDGEDGVFVADAFSMSIRDNEGQVELWHRREVDIECVNKAEFDFIDFLNR